MSFSRLLNKDGVTMTSAIIGVGLASLGALALAPSFNMVQRQSGWVQDSQEVSSVVNRAEVILQNNQFCQNSFTGINPRGNGTSVNTLVGSSGNNISAGTTFGGRLTLDDIVMQNFTPDSPQSSTGWAEIMLRFSRTGNTPLGGRRVDRVISSVRVGLNAPANQNGMVQTCQSDSSMAADMCIALGGTFDPTSNPPCRLSALTPEEFLPWSPGAGNAGGNAIVENRCPNNWAAVGMRGRSGAAIDFFSLKCKEIDRSVYPPVTSGPTLSTLPVGGGGGSNDYDVECPAGQFVVGYGGRAQGTVTQISVICNDYEQSGSETVLSSVYTGQWGGSPFQERCPANKFVKQIQTRYHQYMTGARAVCQ